MDEWMYTLWETNIRGGAHPLALAESSYPVPAALVVREPHAVEKWEQMRVPPVFDGVVRAPVEHLGDFNPLVPHPVACRRACRSRDDMCSAAIEWGCGRRQGDVNFVSILQEVTRAFDHESARAVAQRLAARGERGGGGEGGGSCVRARDALPSHRREGKHGAQRGTQRQAVTELGPT